MLLRCSRAPEQERENARIFIDWLTSSRGEECYIEAKSCRLPANSTARAADGLPPLDEVKLITYDLEWAGENRTRLISYFDTHIYSARTLRQHRTIKAAAPCAGSGRTAAVLCGNFVS